MFELIFPRRSVSPQPSLRFGLEWATGRQEVGMQETFRCTGWAESYILGKSHAGSECGRFRRLNG